MTAVYSADRVRRLRIVLRIVVGMGVLVAVLAAFVLARGENRGAGVFALVLAGMVLGSSTNALRVLPQRERSAKVATVVTGVVCLVAGIGLGGTWLALLLPLLGLGLLFLALVNDEPEASPR